MSSYSYSNPITPPADLVTQGILDNISNVALNYANQIYSWGQGVFNNVMNVTNQNLASLTQAADTAMGGANSSMNAFNNSFMPDYQTLRTEAANYANPGREASNAGGAESGQMQGNQAAMDNAKQALQSYGIDPSSGRYADLEMAGRTAGAAAAVGAGQQSIRADVATGLGLQKQALDYGIQMPGIAANFLNQANQANSIKQNAITSAANTGANLMSLPNAYLNTAKVGYPPSGQSSFSGSNKGNSGQNGGGGGGGGGSFNQAPLYGGSNGSGPSGYQMPNNSGGAGNSSFNSNPSQGLNIDGSPVNDTNFTDYSSNNNTAYGGQSDPFASNYGGYNSPNQYNGSDPTASYNDPTAAYNGSYGSDPSSYSATQVGNAPSDWNTYNTPANDSSTWSDPTAASSSSSFDPNSYSADTSSLYTGDTSSYNYGDQSSFDNSSFAAGGAIPDPTSGGQVPMAASPSMGAQTDDVHAKLNAGEFVIPKDVAAWKGHEFFQKLIAQSRKGRATAGAHGKPTSPPTGPVRFASQPMG